VIYRFGLFEFDPAAGELRKQGRLVRIEPQPARALALLVAHPGEVISRERLRAHLWDAGTHVDYDRGLAYCLGQVRTALGDTAENPRYVETLPRRGFRFIAPVQRAEIEGGAPVAVEAVTTHTDSPMLAVDGAVAAPHHGAQPSRPAAQAVTRGWLPLIVLGALVTAGVAWTAWARMAPARPRVAVAVFDNETGRPEFDRLAATAADIVVERLTALGTQRVGVIGNTPSLRVPRARRDPAAVQRETGAGYFVLGQVQDDDVGVRLVVHLIRLDDDTHLWVTRVARAPADLSDIQDIAADRLAEAVRRHVIERDPDAPRFTR
jgi:DNA-binding winged helix-turn-helix (wHTH) protein/TolB-like protein